MFAYVHACVFIVRLCDDFEDVVAIDVKHPLRLLILHDMTAPYIEIVCVRVAEPVVDDHGKMDLVFMVGLNGKVNGNLNDEVVLVKLGAFLVLPNAEMNGQRRKPTFFVHVFPI